MIILLVLKVKYFLVHITTFNRNGRERVRYVVMVPHSSMMSKLFHTSDLSPVNPVLERVSKPR